MLNRFLLALVCLFSFSVFVLAQDEDGIDEDYVHGGYISPVVKFSSIKNDFACFIGLQGGWIIDHQFVIGAAGYGLVNKVKAPDQVMRFYETRNNLYYQIGYGGLHLEYISEPMNSLHVSISALIGAGGALFTEKTWADRAHDSEWENAEKSYWESNTTAFFVFEPSVQIEMDIRHNLRLDFGAGYRLFSGANGTGMRSSDFSKPELRVGFKFGIF
ncbi:MAG: hypothetical protein LWX56_10285 [Ignavibacteria bacterium]|nr:hypothetical protein [Ignavibacteria bacterium]